MNGTSETELKKMIASANLNVRSSASPNGKLITTIPLGTEVSISTENSEPLGEWARIIYNNASAFVSSKYLTEASPWNSKNSIDTQNKNEKYFIDKILDLSTSNKLMIAGSAVLLISLIGYTVTKRNKK